jgi:arrestin-2
MAANIAVAKKTSPNGKLTVYVGNRNLVDRIDVCDPVEGVILVDDEYLNGRKVFGQLIMKYQYGRDDDEVMGIKFSRDYMLCRQQIYPPVGNGPVELSPMQAMLVEKFQAHPFSMETPENSPSSVELQLGLKEKGNPMGVFYRLECYVAQDEHDIQRKRNMVVMDITKSQRAVVRPSTRQPHISVCKSPTLGSGRIDLEIVLDRAVYYHGQNVMANVNVINGSNLKIEKIKNSIIQTINVSMICCEYSKKVATLKTRDGCPIRPGGRFSQTFILTPLAISNRSRRGELVKSSWKMKIL